MSGVVRWVRCTQDKPFRVVHFYWPYLSWNQCVFHDFYNIHAILPLPKDHIHYWQLKSWEPFVFASAFAMTGSQNLYASRWYHLQISCAQCHYGVCRHPLGSRTPGITVDMVDDRTKSFLPNALRTNVFYCLQLCIANSSKWDIVEGLAINGKVRKHSGVDRG